MQNQNLTPMLIRQLAGKYHTPFYLFDEQVIRQRCQDLKSAVTYPETEIHYACKALTLQAVLKIMKSEGLGIDASSLNEVKRALLAGFSAEKISYTGESASVAVFNELLELGVFMNCSSLDQIRLLGQLKPGIKFSFRLNPGEGHGANSKVNTGGPASKHGIYIDQVDQVKALCSEFNIQVIGVHTHIGSGADLSHWLRIKDITLSVAREFSDLSFINLGGGLPVVYHPELDQPMPLKAWGEQLTLSFEKFSQEYGKSLRLQLEPGRYLVAECGILVAEVQNLKKTPKFNFALVNTGLNHNIRPAMYGSYHPINFITGDGRTTTGEQEYVIAGYLCESGDVFTKNADNEPAPRKFFNLQLGDLMVMGHVGAYSHAMKSEYNSMNLPISLLRTNSGEIKVIERRGTLEDIMRREIEAY